MSGGQGAFDLWDDVPLTLADDPELDLKDLLTVRPIGRQEPTDTDKGEQGS